MNGVRNGFFNDLVNQFAWVLGADDFVAVAVDDFTLLVHHIIKVEDSFTPCVVTLFNALLSCFNGLVEPLVLESFTVFHAEAFHHVGHALGGGEVAHQVVFERNEELAHAGVALTRATTT